MQATEEGTRVVPLEDLKAELLDVLTSGRWGFAAIPSEIDAVREASSYAELLHRTNGIYAGFLTHGVLDGKLKSVQTQLVEQLARIEQEHAPSTSFAALRDRVVGMVDDTEWPSGRVKQTETYEELYAVVEDIMFFFVQSRNDAIVNQLAEVRTLLGSKVSAQ